MAEINIGLTGLLSELIISIKSVNNQWMQDNLDNIYRNRQKKAKLDLDLEETIRLRKQEIEHELNTRKVNYKTEIDQLEIKCVRQVKAYEHFLDKLEEMKAEIIEKFPNIPTPIALLIHRHASEILDQMWYEAKDAKQKANFEKKLIHLLNTISEDVAMLDKSENGTYNRPEKTINLILDQ